MMDSKKNMADGESFFSRPSSFLVSSFFLFFSITISEVAKLRAGEMNSEIQSRELKVWRREVLAPWAVWRLLQIN